MAYAGFLKRTAAYFIDSLIYGIITYAIAFVLGITLALTTSVNPNTMSAGQNILFSLASSCISLACYLTYYVWAESSAWQATIGKKLMGLKVTDIYGRRISFWRSLGRNVGMILSAIIIGIGYLMCIWTLKKQCLHDKITDCLVVDTTPDEKQGCAIGIVVGWLFLSIIFIGGIIAAIAIPQYNRIAEKARAAQVQRNQRQADMDQIQQRLKEEIQRAESSWNSDNEEK